MPRYDKTYARLAERSVRQGAINIDTFIENMLSQGVGFPRISQMMMQDIESDGPLFGSFVRSLTGAAHGSVLAAERQGDALGVVRSRGQASMNRLLGLSKQGLKIDSPDSLNKVAQDADPEVLEHVEAQSAPLLKYTWVASSGNVCHLCLPLHGTTMLMSEWNAQGMTPATIHPTEWTARCKCQLIPEEEAGNRSDLVAPLVRKRVEGPSGIKGSKRTQRAISQKDIEKSLAARDKAIQTKEGRRTLRLMGQQLTGE